MTELEDLKQGAQVKGFDPTGSVAVINVKWFDPDVVELTYRDQKGQPIEIIRFGVGKGTTRRSK